jgi:hypothetical protein
VGPGGIVGGVCSVYSGADTHGWTFVDNGEAPARPGPCALAKHMRLAEGRGARQRDSRDRVTGLRLAATTDRAIPTPSPGQRKGGAASPAKRPLGCPERCIRNLAARQRRQPQSLLRVPMLRLHWRRPAIRGKIQSRYSHSNRLKIAQFVKTVAQKLLAGTQARCSRELSSVQRTRGRSR